MQWPRSEPETIRDSTESPRISSFLLVVPSDDCGHLGQTYDYNGFVHKFNFTHPFFLFCLQGALNSDNCPIISKCAPHNLNNHFTCIGYVDIITGLLDHTRRFFRNLWYWLDKTIYINANELRFNGKLQYRRCCGHIPIIKLQLTLRFTRWRVY